MEKGVKQQSSEIDFRIFGWIINALGDDSLGKFFGAIPGFFNSNLVKNFEQNFPDELLFSLRCPASASRGGGGWANTR